MQNPDLWTHLKSHPLIAPAHQETFIAKLMRSESWSRRKAEQAVEEYRRFLYLTQVMESEPTPSGPVDAVWHLHMTYTRDYWDRLCKSVLGRKLHHNPGKSTGETPRFQQQYEATKARYEVEFADPPPRQFWPGPPAKRVRKLVRTIALFAVPGVLLGLYLGPDNVLGTLAMWFGAGAFIAGVISFANGPTDNAGYCTGANTGGPSGGDTGFGADCGGGD